MRAGFRHSMSVPVAEATVDPLGRVVLDHLAFEPGEKVDVVVRSHDSGDRVPSDLHGSVLRYENPRSPPSLKATGEAS
jgi:hypothetical protein